MKISRLVFLIIVTIFFLSACKMSINENYSINDGDTATGSKNTINGKIHIGDNADVKGECRSINGNIDVGDNSKVRDLVTINGNVHVGKDSLVKGDIQLVNGSVRCEKGIKITGCVETINGKIVLKGTSVEENLSTYNGNIELTDSTVIGGDILIKERHGASSEYRELRVEIDNSIVEGDIINRDPDTDVIVYLKNGGKVRGKIIDAEITEE